MLQAEGKQAMRELRLMALPVILVIVVVVLVSGMRVWTAESVAREEVPRFSPVARKIFTPKCSVHF